MEQLAFDFTNGHSLKIHSNNVECSNTVKVAKKKSKRVIINGACVRVKGNVIKTALPSSNIWGKVTCPTQEFLDAVNAKFLTNFNLKQF